MSYTPTTWHKGDKVTAERLNKIEQGIVDAEQSGSSLPDYSQANDDDVLAIENGEPTWKEPGGSGVFLIETEIDMQTGLSTLKKTWQEIYDALKNGKVGFMYFALENEYTNAVAYSPVIAAQNEGNNYIVMGIGSSGAGLGVSLYKATSADGYPVQQE